MAPPTSYNMGLVHTSGELPREDEDLAISEYSCQSINSHSNSVDCVTSFIGTNPQHSIAAPTTFEQLFRIHPFFKLLNPPNHYELNDFAPHASPADPPAVSSSHESPWSTRPIRKPMGPTSLLNPDPSPRKLRRIHSNAPLFQCQPKMKPHWP